MADGYQPAHHCPTGPWLAVRSDAPPMVSGKEASVTGGSVGIPSRVAHPVLVGSAMEPPHYRAATEAVDGAGEYIRG
jgi:hypothetical protein